MSGFQRGTSTINRKSGLKWGGVDADFFAFIEN